VQVVTRDVRFHPKPPIRTDAAILASMLMGLPRVRSITSAVCPVCGTRVDMRDLGQITAHMHDAEIETCESLDSTRDYERGRADDRKWLPKIARLSPNGRD
jgi:hypothetical protein